MLKNIQSIILTSLLWLISLNSFATEIMLAAEEKHYLKQHPMIKMCVDPDWLPYEKLHSSGRHIGLVAEYMSLLAFRLDVTFKIVKSNSWEETQNLYRSGKCDIVSALNKTSAREQYLDFTQPYIQSPAVLTLNANNSKDKKLSDLSGKKLGMVKGYVYESKLRKDYPDIIIEYVPNMKTALNQVATGKIDATLGPLFLTFSLTQKLNLDSVKLIGHTEYQDELRIGIKKNQRELSSILEKAVSSLSKDDHAMVRKTWAMLQQ